MLLFSGSSETKLQQKDTATLLYSGKDNSNTNKTEPAALVLPSNKDLPRKTTMQILLGEKEEKEVKEEKKEKEEKEKKEEMEDKDKETSNTPELDKVKPKL